MLSREEYIRISLEVNLFFQRIMKEHLFFIETNLQPVEAGLIGEANMLKRGFENLLTETVFYANGVISRNSIKSNEFVTPYTLKAEEVNSKLTGANLDTEITMAELKLGSRPTHHSKRLENIVWDINIKSLNLLKKVIGFQDKLIALGSDCKIFITLYPEMLKHVTEEAVYYMEILQSLQNGKLPKKTLCDELDFWNYIMGEHAEFIDGMLDPTEKPLKDTAETFAKKFEKLVGKCIREAEKAIHQRSIENTEGIIYFKRDATEGILECDIKSIIPPLLADHVLREANHYLRMLKN